MLLACLLIMGEDIVMQGGFFFLV